MSSLRTIVVTEKDLQRLHALIDSRAERDAEAAELLEEELTRAVVVPQNQIPANVVTMNSRVVFEDEQTKQQREVTLVYPGAADAASHKVSVLAPVGAALLGLAVGQSIDWPLPGGRTARLRILSVLYQPEASGDFEL